MTTTNLSVATKVWNEDHQHKQFHFYNSTPDVGTVEEGTAFTFIVVDGVVIKRIEGLVSGYISTVDGAVAHCYYVDRAGNAGDWVTETFSVTNTFDRTYYVDATGGSDSNDGLSTGAPKQTLVGAITALQAAWVSGESNRILLKRGEAFTTTGASAPALWTLSSYTGCITFGAYDSGARPLLTLAASGNGTQFIAGALGTCGATVRGLELNGANTTSGRLMSCTATPSGTGSNVAFIDCEAHTFDVGILGPQTTLSSRTAIDHIAVVGCTFDNFNGSGGGLFFGFDFSRYMLFQDCTFLQATSTNGFIRTSGISYACWDNVTFDRSGGGTTSNVLRFNGGDGTTSDDKCHRVNLHKVKFIGCTEGIEIEAVQASQTEFADIDANACSMDTDGVGILLKAPVTTGFSPDITRLRVRNCWSRSNSQFNASLVLFGADTAGTERIRSVTIDHCTHYHAGQGQFEEPAFLALTSTTGIEAGCFTLRNNYCFTAANISTGNVFTNATVSMVTVSDHNYLRSNAASGRWAPSTTLAAWRTASGDTLDMNSESDISAAHNLTNVTYLSFDARPAADVAPQSNFGLAGVALVDADKHLWTATTPDVGAFQFGGVAMDDPILDNDIPITTYNYFARL